MEIKLLSSLIKVFKDNSPVCEEIGNISMLKNERVSFQIAVNSDVESSISLTFSGFPGKISAFRVADVPEVVLV